MASSNKNSPDFINGIFGPIELPDTISTSNIQTRPKHIFEVFPDAVNLFEINKNGYNGKGSYSLAPYWNRVGNYLKNSLRTVKEDAEKEK